MVEPIPRHNSYRLRRREIEHGLAALAPPLDRRRFPRAAATDRAQRRARGRWRDALAGFGPVFAACGCYLASRPDVFAPALCSELAGLAERATPASPAAVRERLRRELGGWPEALFARFEEAPREVRLLFQIHRAWLASGEPVTVKLVRPDLDDEQLADDLELLALMAPRLTRWTDNGRREQIGEVLAAARRALEGELDLDREAEALTALAGNVAGELRVPRVCAGLATARVLTTERIDGLLLSELPTGAAGTGAHDALDHRLCRGWLRQVLHGCRFPLAPSPGNVAVTAEGRIVFVAGGFARPRPGWQEQLWQYLEAAAVHDPDRTCAALAALMAVVPADREEVFRRRLRQLQPLRDACGMVTGDHLAEYLLLHWRLAAELGYRPQSALVDFYRALGALQESVRRLAAERDALLVACEQLRLDAELGRWRQQLELAQLGEDLRGGAALIAQLPQKLEAALSAVAEGGLRVKLERSGAVKRRKLASFAGLTPLLALLAGTLLVEHLEALPALGAWSEKLGAVVFLVLGGSLLRAFGAR